jgi:hypothetical protein
MKPHWATLHSSKEHFSYICVFYIQSSRKIHTADNHEAGDDDECISVFSTEKHFEVKSGLLEHLHLQSSSRYVSVIVFLLLLLLLFYTGRSHFMPGLHLWKTLQKSNTKFLLQTCISWGWNDWQPNYIQCMTVPKLEMCGPMEYISVVYTKYIYVSRHTFIYIRLFIYNEIKMEETDFHNFLYSSFW